MFAAGTLVIPSDASLKARTGDRAQSARRRSNVDFMQDFGCLGAVMAQVTLLRTSLRDAENLEKYVLESVNVPKQHHSTACFVYFPIFYAQDGRAPGARKSITGCLSELMRIPCCKRTIFYFRVHIRSDGLDMHCARAGDAGRRGSRVLRCSSLRIVRSSHRLYCAKRNGQRWHDRHLPSQSTIRT